MNKMFFIIIFFFQQLFGGSQDSLQRTPNKPLYSKTKGDVVFSLEGRDQEYTDTIIHLMEVLKDLTKQRESILAKIKEISKTKNTTFVLPDFSSIITSLNSKIKTLETYLQNLKELYDTTSSQALSDAKQKALLLTTIEALKAISQQSKKPIVLPEFDSEISKTVGEKIASLLEIIHYALQTFSDSYIDSLSQVIEENKQASKLMIKTSDDVARKVQQLKEKSVQKLKQDAQLLEIKTALQSLNTSLDSSLQQLKKPTVINLNGLNQAVSALINKFANHSEEFNAKILSLDELTQKLKNITEENKTFKDQLVQKDSEIQKLKLQQTSSADIDDFEKQIEERDRAVAALHQELNTYKDELDKALLDNQSLEEKLAENSLAQDQKQNSRNEYEAEKEKLQKQINYYNDLLRDEKDRTNKLTKQVDGLEQKNKDISDQFNKINQTVTTVMQQYQLSQSQVAQFSTMLGYASQEINKWKDGYQASLVIIQQLRSYILQMQTYIQQSLAVTVNQNQTVNSSPQSQQVVSFVQNMNSSIEDVKAQMNQKLDELTRKQADQQYQNQIKDLEKTVNDLKDQQQQDKSEGALRDLSNQFSALQASILEQKMSFKNTKDVATQTSPDININIRNDDSDDDGEDDSDGSPKQQDKGTSTSIDTTADNFWQNLLARIKEAKKNLGDNDASINYFGKLLESTESKAEKLGFKPLNQPNN